jgi:hypothetical protein
MIVPIYICNVMIVDAMKYYVFDVLIEAYVISFLYAMF